MADPRHVADGIWQLRSAISLARTLSARGEGALGRRHLTQVVDRFEEGHGEADLVEARSLLDAKGR